MHILQGLLFIAGGMVLGIVLGFFAIAMVVGVFQPPGEAFGRGMGQLTGGMICRRPLGGIVGLAASFACFKSIAARNVPDFVIWIGTLSGAMGGIVTAIAWGDDAGRGWALLCVAAAGATIGCLIASITFINMPQRKRPKRRRKR